MRVIIYTKPDCHLCEDTLDLLDRLTPQYGLDVHEVNILGDTALYEEYHDKIPVVQVGDGRLGRLAAPITEPELRSYLDAVRRILPPPSAGAPPKREPLIDRMARSIGRHWLRIVLVAMGVFVGLAWLVPVFSALGWWDIANPIYTAYALTCHQLPERAGSIFGYQVAFCYRNTALYGGMLLFGGLYGLARDRNVSWLRSLKSPIAWWVFALFLLPMAIDGLTHMLGLRDNMDTMNIDATFVSFYIGSQAFSLNWWLRIITGLLAALGTVWFAFPRMERAVEESEALRLMYKQSVIRGRGSVPNL